MEATSTGHQLVISSVAAKVIRPDTSNNLPQYPDSAELDQLLWELINKKYFEAKVEGLEGTSRIHLIN